ncbi:hypothetical protein OSB04_012498 [Centaurea solstitialis]|uniref:Uncharacterized protein n=1 Tax=Centaurea solstitialis TaxID=347529 RepID=A0AA38WQ19_9ASTR|nr:hypothetical protein OSB04_012498 [Centaurea solstitialis]
MTFAGETPLITRFTVDMEFLAGDGNPYLVRFPARVNRRRRRHHIEIHIWFRCHLGTKSVVYSFIYQHGRHRAYLLLCVDDIVLTASDLDFLRSSITSLS